MVGSSSELESFPGFRMAILWDCLHMVGILLSMKHLLSIASSHLLALGPIFFSCSIKTSSRTTVYLSLIIPLLSLLKGYTMVSPSVAGGST